MRSTAMLALALLALSSASLLVSARMTAANPFLPPRAQSIEADTEPMDLHNRITSERVAAARWVARTQSLPVYRAAGHLSGSELSNRLQDANSIPGVRDSCRDAALTLFRSANCSVWSRLDGFFGGVSVPTQSQIGEYCTDTCRLTVQQNAVAMAAACTAEEVAVFETYSAAHDAVGKRFVLRSLLYIIRLPCVQE
jgi:hypothetical protein